MSEPREDHMAALKHLLWYIVETKGFGLKYKRAEGEFRLMGYSDRDLAGDIDDRRSTTKLLFFLEGNPVSWLSQKQKVMTKSSCEAEYMASAGAASQAVWVHRVLEVVTGVEVPVPVIRMDNTTAIALAKNPVLHECSKHRREISFHQRMCRARRH
jgi:hypothetical protein